MKKVKVSDSGIRKSLLVEVIVAKNRQGPCGTVRLRFDKNTTGFYPFPASYSAYSESPEEEIEESIDF